MEEISQPRAFSNISVVKFLVWLKKTVLGSKAGIRDVIVSMVPQGVHVVTGFVTSVLVARGLGPAGLGQYTLVTSLSGMATSLSDLGIGQTAIRFAARAAAQGDRKGQLAVLRWAFRLRLVLILSSTLFLFLLSPTLAQKWRAENLLPIMRVGLLAGIFHALAAVPVIYFQSIKRFGVRATVSTCQTLISFFGILLLAWLNHWSVSSVISVSLTVGGIGALVFLFIVPKEALLASGGPKAWFRADVRDFWKSPVPRQATTEGLDGSSSGSFAFFMMLSSIIAMVILRADVWLMGVFLDQAQIGIYNVGTRFTLPLIIVLHALNAALWPRASALTDPRSVLALLRKTFRLCILVSCAGLVYALGVPLLTPILFGSRYANSVLLGQMLSIHYCIAILYSPLMNIGYNFGMARILWLINIVQLLIIVVINLFLLPVWGPVASPFALIVNDIAACTLIWAFLWRKVQRVNTTTAVVHGRRSTHISSSDWEGKDL